MAVSHSAASESAASTSAASFSWTHTQTGTPQGAIVFVITDANADYITSVTYGGVAMTRVSGGQAIDAAGEPGRCDLFFLGSGLPTGNATITVNRTNNATTMGGVAATVLADTRSTEVYSPGIVLLQGDGTLSEQNVTDGNPGSNSVRYAGLFTGLQNLPGVGANSTLLNELDFGATGMSMVRETTAGQGSRPVGWSSGNTDDRAAVHVAVIESFQRRVFTVT